MRWIEVVIDAKNRETDSLCDALAGIGIDGLIIEDESDFHDFLENNREYWDYVDEELTARFAGVSRLKFYLSDDASGLAALSRLRAELSLEPQLSYVEDGDWENGWRKFYAPIYIGERLVIVPEWEAAPFIGNGDRLPLLLNPGLGFGTGGHATTRMCLEAAQRYAAKGSRALDIGCGSGILGIAACLLGCAEAAGCDVDPIAADAAAENAALNGLSGSRFRVYTGDVLKDEGLQSALGGGYDLIFANIAADAILPLLPFARRVMAGGAVFICSGIIDGREDEVKAALKAAGLEEIEHLREDEWHCFAAR